MSLFSNNKKRCPICGEPTPRLFPTKIEGMPICKQCAQKIHLPAGAIDKMNMMDFEDYLAFYDANEELRSKFRCEYRFDVDGWSAEVNVDLTNGLFRLSDRDDAIVFRAADLLSFRITEDNYLLYEGSAKGLYCYQSDVPQRIAEMEPEVMRFVIERREYEHRRHLQEMRNRGRDEDEKDQSYIPRPIFTITEPIAKFRVQMTMQHDYWPEFEGELDGPSFNSSEPSTYDYMNSYRTKANALEELAHTLMRMIAPSAPVIWDGQQVPPAAPVAAAPAASAPVDAVTEIQRFKGLLDAGIITEEEFTAKKRQLLGI